MLVIVTIPTANAPITAFSDPLNGPWPTPDVTATGLHGTVAGAVYRKTNISNAPTSLSVTGTSGSFAATFVVVEVAGLDNVSPVVSTIPKTDLSGGVAASTHTANFTTTNTSDFVFSLTPSSASRMLNSATNSFTVVPSEAAASFSHAVYLDDAGAAGAKSTLLTFSANTSAHIFGAIYKAGKPAVTSVTGDTTAEGGSNVFTVTLASATSATTGYSGSLAGVTADTSADLTSTLLTATCTNSVTYSAGNFSVPSGVSSWTVTIATTQDALDEVDETYTLTVDGTVSGTGTITDDDDAPTISVNDATENAGEVIFTVSLSAASGKTITVDYATADGTSTAGVDYTAKTGTLTFAAGETTKTVTVTVP